MKRLLLLIPILTLVLLPIGCVDIDRIIEQRADDMLQEYTTTYTIKVGGTVGLNFTGEYEVWFFHFDPDTQSLSYSKDSYSVEGQVPEQYTFEGMVTVVMFQKRTDCAGLLEIKIWGDEVWMAQRETTDPWGAVYAVVGLIE